MSSESEEDEYDSELDEEAVLANATAPGQAADDREPINNVEALEEALEDIAWPATVNWLESQAINSAEATAIDDVEDDLSRELAFYNQALAAAQRGVAQLETAGVLWRRPADYYAEMVKSDDHMLKVKEQLMFEQRQIEETAQRRKQREMKKFGKQVSAEVRKDRAANKKAAVDSISRLRKARAKGGYEGDLDMDAELQRLDRRQNAALAARGDRMGPGGRKPGAKREARNSRYGFGGRKRLDKQNDAASAADMEDFRMSRADRAGGGRGRRERGRGRGGGFGGRGSGGRGASPGGFGSSPGGGGRGKGKKGKTNRPGKDRRAAMRG